jgi:putative glycerol-1-phosphate prenyltransferase
MNLLQSFADGKKKLAVLVDPDNYTETTLKALIEISLRNNVTYFLVGGSLLHQNKFENTVRLLKQQSKIPVIIFPGSAFQVSADADGILFLSLVSGRNPEYLIAQQVAAAPVVKQTQLEVIPTAYILVEGGNNSTTAYITQTIPIPANKPQIVATTALAASYLGMKAIYLEAGSGAEFPVNIEAIQSVKKNVGLPLIVGGGINNAEKAKAAFDAGADVVVVGNILESNPAILSELCFAL